MKTRFSTSFRSLSVLCLALAATPGLGQAPVISSFSQNGELVCTNLEPSTVATVEWAPSVAGPWTNNWGGLDAVTADGDGKIRVSVPMFYRVRGVSPLATLTNMVLIPPGPFTMGDTFSEGSSLERPLHTNQISAFYMDQYEVTQALWDEVRVWANTNGYDISSVGSGKAPNHPVQEVSWYDVVKWCNARSQKEGRTPAYYTSAAQTTVYRSGEVDVQNDWVKWNTGYRLPTEAEWEKAARGGASGHRFPWVDADTIAHSRANYQSDTRYAYNVNPTTGYHPSFLTDEIPFTSPAGYFASNGYGLFDMAGNVEEWCWDRYGSYSSGSQEDPRGPTTRSERMVRGGSWSSYAFDCRLAFRISFVPADRCSCLGFRSVLPPGQP